MRPSSLNRLALSHYCRGIYVYIYMISNYSEVINLGLGLIKFIWSWSMLTLESPYHDYLKTKHRHHLSVLLVYVIKHTKASKIVIFLSYMHVLVLFYLNIFCPVGSAACK